MNYIFCIISLCSFSICFAASEKNKDALGGQCQEIKLIFANVLSVQDSLVSLEEQLSVFHSQNKKDIDDHFQKNKKRNSLSTENQENGKKFILTEGEKIPLYLEDPIKYSFIAGYEELKKEKEEGIAYSKGRAALSELYIKRDIDRLMQIKKDDPCGYIQEMKNNGLDDFIEWKDYLGALDQIRMMVIFLFLS